jgi:hypothetical protein
MKNLLVMLMVIAMCSTGFATLLTVYNHSFEEPALADGGAVGYTGGASSPPYWLSAGTTQVLNPLSTNPLQPSDSSQYAYIFSGGVLQQGAWLIEASTVYTATVDLATFTALSPEYAWSWVGFYVVPDGGSFTTLNVEKYGWNSLGNGNLNTEIPTGQFGTFSVSWDSTGSSYVGEVLILRFQSDRVYYDNVRMEAIPEPATLAILGLGGLGLLRRRK